MPDAFTLTVNGTPHAVPPLPDRPLLAVLRYELGLTGAKYGCGEGECGACAVLLGDEAVAGCTTLLSEVGGRAVTTIEGLADGERLHPVQQAFLDADALQCGYCTPGMIIAAVGLLRRNPAPTGAEAREALQPHLCRCGAYARILDAVQRAGAALRAGETVDA